MIMSGVGTISAPLRYIAGVGCRVGVSPDDIVAAVHAALAACQLPQSALAAIACIPAKGRQEATHAAAAMLGLPLVIARTDALAEAASRCLTRSQTALRATGLPSASEAAALAVAGAGSQLLAPRSIAGAATCAIAGAPEPEHAQKSEHTTGATVHQDDR